MFRTAALFTAALLPALPAAAADLPAGDPTVLGGLSVMSGGPDTVPFEAAGPLVRLNAGAQLPLDEYLAFTLGFTFDYQALGTVPGDVVLSDGTSGGTEIRDKLFGGEAGVLVHSAGPGVGAFGQGVVGLQMGSRVYGDQFEGLFDTDDDAAARGLRARALVGAGYTPPSTDGFYVNLGVGLEGTTTSFEKNVVVEPSEDAFCLLCGTEKVGEVAWTEKRLSPVAQLQIGRSF